MDDHKPVMISIFLLSKHEKDASFLVKICLEKFLRFGRRHENIFFKKNILEKIRYFSTGFVFYNVNIQPDIMPNW